MLKKITRLAFALLLSLGLTHCGLFQPKKGDGGGMGGMRPPRLGQNGNLPSDAVDSPAEQERRRLEQEFGRPLNHARIPRDLSDILARNQDLVGNTNLANPLGSISALGGGNAQGDPVETFDPTGDAPVATSAIPSTSLATH